MAVQSIWSREATRQLFRRFGSVTILATESLSDAFEIGMANNVVVQVDTSAWTAAGITFQVSLDGSAWSDLLNASGEVAFASDAAGRAYQVPAGGFRYIKVRSGTSGTPVAQAADRTILVGAYD